MHMNPAARRARRALAFVVVATVAATPSLAQTSARLPDETAIIRVARGITPAVVSVVQQGIGSGSGVIIRADGVILTNAHVVGDARTVEVGLADGRRVAGTVLARDPAVDVAVVRVALTGLPTAPLGNSDQLEVGQTAIAIGNPIGLDRTVTTGIISAVNRSPRGFELGGLIQTDAAINPGNSGGPLLDSQGRVVGINSAILQGTTGLGFAIPINLAQDIANQVLTTGHIVRAYLGIIPADLSPEIAQRFGLPVREGVIVRGVGEGTPAARAGLQPADIITSIDGTAIPTTGELFRVLRGHRPGDTIRISIVRLDARAQVTGRPTVTARLAEAPAG
ncbi:MAG: PDZ domain-containing protein [Gemmatimonadaceae bacterium]|nr:PDZ domain-containing protein [Gemmatimonadaceae bacterium]NUQ91274.1 PDZ domain-containing protein [Gemmatimonadaceae bacterium]NUR18275.1 PDZ domain-containing protein [Gemmatimonadaceae bacterium]NUS95895.1 PDZ domain-containing protein [Gemmatimonadaceae bacterium]